MKIATQTVPGPAQPAKDAALKKASQDLEAAFLTQMLKPMGAEESRQSMGGGIGEEQFSSFLVEAEAKAVVKAGGVGLAESIFTSLKRTDHA